MSAALLGLLAAAGPVAATGAADEPSPADGVLVPTYEAARTPEDQQVKAFLSQNHVLEGIADYAAERVKLPQDVPLHATSCGEPNAFWLPASQDITFCYELFTAIKPLLAEHEPGDTEQERSEELDKDLIGVTNSFILHELGHALVSLYDIPVIGQEEDAADQFAALLLNSGDEQHVAYSVSTIYSYGVLADAEEQGQRPIEAYADEHSLHAQRYYNWACWLYGSDTARYATLQLAEGNPNGILPPDRANRCPGEYQQIEKAWGPYLEPYVRS
ncbi:DUF4344 domain-containing metallopeptidase [Kitasatospora misakiensis]|uniref:DUF4344 domain-containing metallopeptidase n=1 Tax=Kitasatospora misakiensis TaxID=67330 RepID=A0ABW0X9H3_9ACTN